MCSVDGKHKNYNIYYLQTFFLCYNIEKMNGGFYIMARGKRLSNTEVLVRKIADLDEKIRIKMDAVNELKEQKKQLEKELKMAKLEDISSLLDEKNMTVDQLKELVENQVTVEHEVNENEEETVEEVTE